MTSRHYRQTALAAGLLLLVLNGWGLFSSLRNADIYVEVGVRDAGDITLTAEQLSSIQKGSDETAAAFASRANEAVYKGIAHYWDDAGRDRYNLHVPVSENFLLYAAGFLFPKHFGKYEFTDAERAIERGAGLCSQHAIVLVHLLESSGVDAGILGLGGHTVAYAATEKGEWILDPDYGVVVERSPESVQANPGMIRKAYEEAGLSAQQVDDLVGIYGPDANRAYPSIQSYKSWKAIVEQLAYFLKWMLPVCLIGLGAGGAAPAGRFLRTHRKRVAVVGLPVLIVCLALALRVLFLADRGIYEYDEGWYLLESKSLYDTGAWVLGLGADGTGLKEHLRSQGNVPITSFKPGHNLNILIGFLLFGVSDFAGLLMSALFGAATVLVVFYIARELWGTRAGTVAALVLAVSAFHIAYSRNAYAQADSTFFVALAALLWIRAHAQSRDSLLVCAGLAVGYGFTCHYNVGLVPFIFVALEAVMQRGRGAPQAARRLALLSFAMLLPLLWFELPGRLLREIGLAPAGFHTYIEQFFVRRTDRMAASLQLSPWVSTTVLERFLLTEGLFALAATLAGAVAAVKTMRREPRVSIVLALGLIPLAFWLTVTKGVDIRYRVFLAAFPFLAVLAGYGFDRLTGLFGSGRRVYAAAAIVATIGLLDGMIRSLPLLQVRGGYAAAAERLVDYASRTDGRIAFSPRSAWPVWNFYLAVASSRLPAERRPEIDFYSQKDDLEIVGDFEVVDRLRYLRGIRTGNADLLAYLDATRQSGHAVVSVPTKIDILPDRYLEGGGPSYARSYDQLRNTYPHAARIEIHDLRISSAHAVAGEPFGRL